MNVEGPRVDKPPVCELNYLSTKQAFSNSFYLLLKRGLLIVCGRLLRKTAASWLSGNER